MSGPVNSKPAASLPLSGTEVTYLIQGGADRQTTAADVGNAATNSLKTTGNQTKTSGLLTLSGGVRAPWVEVGTQRQSVGTILQVFGGIGNDFSRTDGAMQTGAWRYDHTGGDSGGPISERGVIYHSQRTGGGGESQFFVSESSGRIFSRSRVTGAWTDWREYGALAAANTWAVAQTFSSNITVNGVVQGSAATGMRVQLNTSDGSDTGEAFFCGGGAAGTARGAYIRAQGNEHASRPGRLELYAGAVSGGSIVIGSDAGFGGVAAPTCSIDTNGFSKLGESAPKTKKKKITGTSPASAGDDVAVAHGLTFSKIVGMEAIVTVGGTTKINEGSIFASNAFSVTAGATNIVLSTGPSASFILSSPFSVLVEYEE